MIHGDAFANYIYLITACCIFMNKTIAEHLINIYCQEIYIKSKQLHQESMISPNCAL